MSQNNARQPIPVGKYFLERGKITQEQLDVALQHRSEFGLKLGQSLVELNLVTESDMVEALRHQARFPCIHLTSGIVETRVAHKLGEQISRRLKAVALNQIAGHTTVALEDPSDAVALEELSHNLGTRIFPVYAEPTAIARILDQTFGHRGGAKPSTPAASNDITRARTPQPEGKPASEQAVDERAVVERVRGFLQEAFARQVTDIHLEARRDALCIRFRVDGALREHARLPRSWIQPTLACLKSLAKVESGGVASFGNGTIPFLFKQQQLEVRVATAPSVHGESAVLHVVRSEEGTHRGLAELGLPEERRKRLQELLAVRGGLYLVAGPAGSGRTTTLHALLEHVVAPDRKSIALERAGSRTIEGVLHVALDAAAGQTFAQGARALLAQDPDHLLLGAIDDRESLEVALELALSGRTVFGAANAGGALDSIARLLRLGADAGRLADGLRAVVGQRLVRRICTECKTPIVPDESLRERLDLTGDAAPYHEGEGCGTCQATGFVGRAALFEVVETSAALRREIERGAGRREELLAAARAAGFVNLREHGLAEARAGQTTLNEVLANTDRG